MSVPPIKTIIETALLVAGQPLTLARLQELFDDESKPTLATLRQIIDNLQEDYQTKGMEVKELASGYCIQARVELAPWLTKLWEEKVGRYSRALLETLALIAYRQPITRGEIEAVRGVAVSSNIIRTLLEREWIHIVGHREVPGKPSLYATTKHFLDDFNVKSLEELPPLTELQNIDFAALKSQASADVSLEEAIPNE